MAVILLKLESCVVLQLIHPEPLRLSSDERVVCAVSIMRGGTKSVQGFPDILSLISLTRAVADSRP